MTNVVKVGRFWLRIRGVDFSEVNGLPDFSGVRFVVGDQVIEAINHLNLGERLHISHRTEPGHLMDIPFHMGTAHFLPYYEDFNPDRIVEVYSSHLSDAEMLVLLKDS